MRKKLPLISGILNVLEKLKGNTGIIENTSVATHTIAAGKYVIWKNDLYKASSAISIGDTLSLSNLTAVSDGIANELNSNVTWKLLGTLYDNTTTLTIPTGCHEILCRYIQRLRNNRSIDTHILPIAYINDSPYGTSSMSNALCIMFDAGSIKAMVIKCSSTEIRLNEFVGAGDSGNAVDFWYR